MAVEAPSLEDLIAPNSPPPAFVTSSNEQPHRKSSSSLKQGTDGIPLDPVRGVSHSSRSVSPQMSLTHSSRHTPLNTPPRKLSGDQANLQAASTKEVPIDPALLDVTVDPPQADNVQNQSRDQAQALGVQASAGEEQEDYNPFAAPADDDFGLTADQLLHPLRPGDPFEFSLAPSADPSDSIGRGEAKALNGPTKTPWSLNTDLNEGYTDSQPASTTFTESPGLGEDGLYHGQPWAEVSREGSMTDLNSYVGSTKGMGTAASSESGYEPNGVKGVQEGVPPPRPKKSHARKQPEGHIKRARNAFILFRKHITDSNLIPPSVEVKHQNISVVAAKMWREAPQDVRHKFQEQARIEKEEHQRKYPGYRYQPVFRRTDIIRRRVRKDPAEDEKVDAVADLLIKGKSGGDLEQEIKEQMVALTQEAEAGDKDGERGDGQGREVAPPAPPMSRRRRREVGQLSKGAIRAQRAQARAKQMRQNLIGSNLLSMSMYNAAQQRAAAAAAAGNATYPGYNMDINLGPGGPGGGGGGGGIAGMGVGGMPNHPGAQHYQYTMSGGDYMPVGYDIDGQAMSYDPTAGMYDPSAQGGGVMGGGGLDAGDMYRLPPIGDLNAGPGYGNGWQGNTDYWGQDPAYASQGDMAIPGGGDGMEYYAHPGGMEGYDHQGGYQLPPFIDATNTHGLHGHADFPQGSGQNPAQVYDTSGAAGPSHSRPQRDMDDPWGHGDGQAGGPGNGQQTPSGHVMFNERLFDGALGSAGLGGLGLSGLGEGGGRDDGMSGFEEAIAQVNEISQW